VQQKSHRYSITSSVRASSVGRTLSRQPVSIGIDHRLPVRRSGLCAVNRDSVKVLIGSGASLAAMLKYTRPKPGYAVGR
jgi:hypothetical protein